MALPCSLLLFDLDGTLVDTAPDLHAAACALRARRGLGDVDYPAFRARVSRGGTAMLGHAFPLASTEEIAELLPEFLHCYADAVAVHSKLFPGVTDVLAAVESSGARWGVVTNKPEGLANALIGELELALRCAVVIGGDTLAARKPDPAPLIEACRRLSEPVQSTVYVGDDPRDITAARAAGMPSIAAGWGYIDADGDARQWGANFVAEMPLQMLSEGWLSLLPHHG